MPENSEPSMSQNVAVIEEMTALRGWIINSFAQVEFIFGDLIARAQDLPVYEEFRAVIPMGIDNRLARLRSMLEVEGPLRKYRHTLELLMDRILDLEDVRHFFTHGFCEFHFTPKGDQAMKFRRYVPPKKGTKGQPVTLKILLVRPKELRELRTKAIIFTTTVLEAFEKIYSSCELNDLGLKGEIVFLPASDVG